MMPSPIADHNEPKQNQVGHGGDDTVAVRNPLVQRKTQSIEAQQVQLLYTQAKISIAGAIVNVGMLAFALWSVVPRAHLLIWTFLAAVLTIFRLVLVHCYFRTAQREEQTTLWLRLMILSAGVSGSLWGSTAVFLFPATSFIHQIFLVFVLGGLTVGSLSVMAPVRIVFLSFFIPTLLPIVCRVFLSGMELSHIMGILLLFFAAFILAASRHLHESITESLQLRSANMDLIRDLSRAKEEAERVNSQLANSHAILRESENRFRSLIEHASDLITILNADGTIRYNSPSLTRLLGYEEQELNGCSAAAFFHPSEEEKLKAAFAVLRKEPSRLESFEFRLRRKDGSWRVFESIAQNLLDDPAVGGMVFNSRDITERKEVERLKDDLVSTVSHELRTPLTSLRGFAELLLTREFSREKQRHFLQVILNEGTRLTNLINDFLDIQRIESGKQTYRFEAMALSALLRDALAVFQTENSQHQFRVAIPDHLPPVRVDVDRLHQVLANLLSNAVKFSPQGGTITLRAWQKTEQLVVEIADEGVGIPADVIPQLFQKFYRADNTETRSIGGTGLGLALVKDIITAHDGHVWVESQSGVGSSFFFSLPVADTVAAAHQPSPLEI